MPHSTNPLLKTGRTLKRVFRRLIHEADSTTESNPLTTEAAGATQELIASAPNAFSEDSTLLQAKALNKQLYSDVNMFSQEYWAQVEASIRGYCNARGFSPDYTQNWVGHRFRLHLSALWLEGMIDQQISNFLALDLGSESPATDLFRERFPQIEWQNTTSDLRYNWEQPDRSVDLIICTELLEHLSDLPEGISDTFYKTGLRAVLQESFRVLKPGGGLFISTPNAASVIQLEAILYGAPPWFYPLHVREYTSYEILSELQEVGFQIQRWQTVHCLTIDYHKDYTKLFQVLLSFNFPLENRGDDIFICALKPSL